MMPWEGWRDEHDYEALAERFGTPFYLYDRARLQAQCARVREAFDQPISLYYAVKANPNKALLQLLREEGWVDGLDIASAGEWELGLSAGWSPEQMSVAGPAKTDTFLQSLLEQRAGVSCVESLEELQRLERLHRETGCSHRIHVMLRINPKTPILAFGLKISGFANPFGIDEERLPEAIEWIKKREQVFAFQGLHVHGGSQCFSGKAMGVHLETVLGLVETCEDAGLPVKCANVGGGFGVSIWKPARMIDVGAVARQLRLRFRETDVRPLIRFELGRYLSAPTGLFVARVISTKASRDGQLCMVDGGMNHYKAASLREVEGGKKELLVEHLSSSSEVREQYMLCGPLCTPLDRMGDDITLPPVAPGDLLGWPNAGAYGLTMSPLLFLGHETPAEVLFDGHEYRLIRRRIRAIEW